MVKEIYKKTALIKSICIRYNYRYWEDVRQDLLIQLFKVEKKGDVNNLIYTCAKNRVIDLKRKEKIIVDSDIGFWDKHHLDDKYYFSRLSIIQQEIVKLRIEGYAYKEIKNILNIPLWKIKNEIHLIYKKQK
jgi:DNA-directed RNA polymerase specialized sigma24 family protein